MGLVVGVTVDVVVDGVVVAGGEVVVGDVVVALLVDLGLVWVRVGAVTVADESPLPTLVSDPGPQPARRATSNTSTPPLWRTRLTSWA